MVVVAVSKPLTFYANIWGLNWLRKSERKKAGEIMTNSEIEKYKEELSTILKEIKYDNNQETYYLQLANGIKKLEGLAEISNSRKYVGVELYDIDSLMDSVEKNKESNVNNTTLKNKCSAYKDIIKEISNNITYKLQTEMMFNACISAEESSKLAKRSCRWAAIAAIAACIGTIITWWPSISKVLGRLF